MKVQTGDARLRLFVSAAVAVGCLVLLGNCARHSPADDIIARIRRGHPRLLMTAETLETLRADLPKNEWLRRRHRDLQQRAERFLGQPPTKYEFHGTDWLVDSSRQVLDRVSTLALLYRLDGDPRYLERCWVELDAAAHFPDWHRAHFLDTAEMTAAFALGYDWLYDAWTPDQRYILRTLIVERGLQPGLWAYKNQNWEHQQDNHNIVDNGGLTLGALAVADEEPVLAGQILVRALASAPHSLQQFGPDGAWPEGPTYWGYQTEYTALCLNALETACGTDFGLGDIPGLRETGWFPLYVNDPPNGAFNYGDADDDHEIRSGPQLFWMAARYHEPRYAQFEMDHPNGRMQVLDVVWGAGAAHQDWQTIPTDRYFRGAELATMRDRWGDPRAWFVGFKAGNRDESHNHLDIGTYVLDAKGVRWALDLGRDDPDLPGYAKDEGPRWHYYRLRAEGHNTLVLNPGAGQDQDDKRAGRIIAFKSTPQGVALTADLTDVYRDAEQVIRSLAYERGSSLRVTDKVKLRQPGEIWSFIQTAATATASPDGRILTLTQAGQTMTLKLLEPARARFELAPAGALPGSPHPPKEAANPGVTRIAVHLSGVKEATIAEEYVP
jgi:hypothetical protein